jgi:hypothetical protein
MVMSLMRSGMRGVLMEGSVLSLLLSGQDEREKNEQYEGRVEDRRPKPGG